jgi:hypothetical protein
MGKAGRMRELDVTICKTVGLVPVMIVVECRRYQKLLPMDRVEAFVTKLWDVGGAHGVMVSRSGFDAGALAAASQHGITLLTYNEARAADWKSVVGDDAWVKLFARRRGADGEPSTIREYVVNPRLGSGHVLSKEADQKRRGVPVLRQLFSEAWDLQQVLRSQEGREVSPAELQQMRERGALIAVPGGAANGLMRVVLRWTKNGE